MSSVSYVRIQGVQDLRYLQQYCKFIESLKTEVGKCVRDIKGSIEDEFWKKSAVKIEANVEGYVSLGAKRDGFRRKEHCPKKCKEGTYWSSSDTSKPDKVKNVRTYDGYIWKKFSHGSVQHEKVVCNVEGLCKQTSL
ncbi:hypothetical protein ACET3Z_014644 [Daucus carota]